MMKRSDVCCKLVELLSSDRNTITTDQPFTLGAVLVHFGSIFMSSFRNTARTSWNTLASQLVRLSKRKI